MTKEQIQGEKNTLRGKFYQEGQRELLGWEECICTVITTRVLGVGCRSESVHRVGGTDVLPSPFQVTLEDAPFLIRGSSSGITAMRSVSDGAR